jgi:glycosyltransferase involved in cell wall biosynthesis
MRKKLVFKAARIIAVSENTKNDCIKIWKVPSEKIDVIYHAPSVMDLGRSSMVETGDYILYVGGRGGYKNFRWFINAVTPILKARPSLKVFCTGQPFSKEELKWLTELNIETQVYAKFVDSRDMFNLYHNAKAFVYPSRYEGFGIPILDAFKAGCPVILSNSSCFKEVGGDAALYFELDDPGSLQKTITDVLDRPLARERMVVCGLERVKEFSWMQASLATARVYDSAFKTSL